MMDCHEHLPRHASGHLDQDGIEEEDGSAFDVLVSAVSGDRLCSISLKEQDRRVQHLKTRISAVSLVDHFGHMEDLQHALRDIPHFPRVKKKAIRSF